VCVRGKTGSALNTKKEEEEEEKEKMFPTINFRLR
jgi:hypothetical protein